MATTVSPAQRRLVRDKAAGLDEDMKVAERWQLDSLRLLDPLQRVVEGARAWATNPGNADARRWLDAADADLNKAITDQTPAWACRLVHRAQAVVTDTRKGHQ